MAARPLAGRGLPAVGGFLLQVLAESLRWPAWVLQLSPYAHLHAVPYESVNWAGTAGMTLDRGPARRRRSARLPPAGPPRLTGPIDARTTRSSDRVRARCR